MLGQGIINVHAAVRVADVINVRVSIFERSTRAAYRVEKDKKIKNTCPVY